MGSRPVIRVGRVLRGLGALVVLLGLVAGVPWALWHFIGWPLPHHVPSVAEVGRALDHQGIPAQALVDALAVVVWFTWALLVASIAAEVPAALSGRHSSRLPFAGAFQPITGRLVAAVAVACLALAPRAGQPSGPGASGGAMASAMVRRPVATLVLTGADLTGTSRPLPPPAIPTAPASPAPSTVAPPAVSAQNGPLRTYVVQRGDTLWGIAERELGDALEWRAIYQLNEGRAEPGGVILTNPHWIDPGWTLLLPAPVTAPAPGAAPATPAPTIPTPRSTASPVPSSSLPAPSAVPSTAAPTALPSTPPPSTPPPSNGTSGMPASVDPSSGASESHRRSAAVRPDARRPPVRLPSGSLVAGSFVAGMLSAVALGRFRRRHSYRYRPPEAGRDLSPAPLRPTLSHLIAANDQAGEDQTADDDVGTGWVKHRVEPMARTLWAPCCRDPGLVEIGCSAEGTVALSLEELCGTALVGTSAPDIARALVVGFLVAAGPGMAEVILAGEHVSQLVPETSATTSVRLMASSEDAARALEAERIARTRRLDAAGAPDAERFRHENPENPLPMLLVVADPPPLSAAPRWAALADDCGRLGISVLYLGDARAGRGDLVVDEGCRVTDCPPDLADRLAGIELFRLGLEEATELLSTLNEALADPGPPEAELSEEEEILGSGHGTPMGREPWPEHEATTEPGTRPICVELLGHMAVTVCGVTVADGLRSRAKMLLAWYLCRPEGATSEEAVEALWPDTAPDGVLRQFWRALGEVRSRLRDAGGDGLDVLEKAGDHYRPAPEEITCDLWAFQAALKDAGTADDEGARAALHRAVAAYRGTLLEGTDWLWVEPLRADLHHRALDAHLRLAALEEAAGHPAAARAVLERAVEVDRYAEEPYRRLMVLHAAAGNHSALRATWRLLQARLEELDLDADESTSYLCRRLTERHRAAGDPAPLGS